MNVNNRPRASQKRENRQNQVSQSLLWDTSTQIEKQEGIKQTKQVLCCDPAWLELITQRTAPVA